MPTPLTASERRDAWLIALAAAVLSLSLAALPLAPAADWPQHLALASTLRRLWDADPASSALFLPNPATHNAGVHLLLAAAARWVSPLVAGRALLALYPPLLLLAAARLLRRLGLPLWRALLLVPAVLGFSFGWGLINFCLGSALAWLLVDGVLAQLDRPRPGRAALLAAGSLVLGVTHVLATLLGGLVAAVACGERCLAASADERRRLAARAAVAGLCLLPGVVYDLHIYGLHVAADAAAYTSPVGAVVEPTLLNKLTIFGALLSGLFTGYGDTAIAWGVLLLLLRMAASAAADEGGWRRLRAPALALAALYLLIPSVFFNTHLIFQRLPQWMLLAALLSIAPGRQERAARSWGLLLVGLYLAALPVFFGLHRRETRGAVEVLRRLPAGGCVTGAIEEPRTVGVRMHTLVHAAALGVVAGATEEGFSFARWMGLPVIYRREQRPPYPDPSWEHDGRRFDASAPLARRCPLVLVRTAWADEPSGQVTLRLFGSRPVRLLARSDSWLLVDAR